METVCIVARLHPVGARPATGERIALARGFYAAPPGWARLIDILPEPTS